MCLAVPECRGGIERRRADLRVPARRRAGNGSRGVSKASADGRVEAGNRRERMKRGDLRFYSATLRNGRACDGARRYAGRSAGASECRGGIERRRAELRVPARRRAGNSSRGVPKGTTDGRVEAGNRRECMKRGRLRFYSATLRNGRACDGVRRYAGRSAGALARRGGIERRRAGVGL